MYWQSVCADGDADSAGAVCAVVPNSSATDRTGQNPAPDYAPAEEAAVFSGG